MVFQEALLRNSHGGAVGFARAGLSDIAGRNVEETLRQAGVNLLLGRTVERLDIARDHVSAVRLAGGESLEADAYVSALPPQAMLSLLPVELRRSPGFAAASTHTWSPIVNLHVWYDQSIDDFDFVGFIDSPVQWVFNRTRIGGLSGPGQYITVSLSGAWEYWPMSKAELRDLFLPELTRLFPAAVNASVQRFIVVKEKDATFRTLPNSPWNRLPSITSIPNLFLAGEWTDTGWPSTMESAVRSGTQAATAIGTINRA
jgi:uncharacterized protein with NAD-binding domain and iron-sulfur cluster